MEFENKSVIKKLRDYFMTQEKEAVCLALASCIVDINRFGSFDRLGKNERDNLILRTAMNLKELDKFLNEDKHEELTVHRMNSEDD